MCGRLNVLQLARPQPFSRVCKFSDLERRIAPADRSFVVPGKPPSYVPDNTGAIERGRRVVLIGFNGKKEGLMYSRNTRKFDFKIDKGWVKVLCSYAAVAPGPESCGNLALSHSVW